MNKIAFTSALKSQFSSMVSGVIDKYVSSNTAACLVITGFWRSGTTWLLQECTKLLEAKSIFEPFDPRTEQNRLPWLRNDLGQAPPGWMPVEQKDHPFSMERILRESAQSRVLGTWVRRARRNLVESTRRKTVVKLVRGQFSLASLQEILSVPVLHIHRDPRSVVASILRADWGNPWLTKIDFSFLGKLQNSDFLRRWESLITQAENGSDTRRVATYWALTEKFVENSSNLLKKPFLSTSYEELVLFPEKLPSNLETLGLKPTATKQTASTASPTTGERRSLMKKEERLSSWKSELDIQQQKEIEEVIDAFGLSDRLKILKRAS